MAADPTDLSSRKLRSGKVRDLYRVDDDTLLLVASDRISAFDWVLPTAVPDKGRVLTALTEFWLGFLNVPNHLVTTDVSRLGPPFDAHAAELAGRSMVVRETAVVPIECVVRGYLSGSAWNEYRQGGGVCGLTLPPGLRQSERLPEPVFTPATKAETGHDENIPFERMEQAVGADLARRLRGQSLDIYRRAVAYAEGRGLLIADTKFEWGVRPDGTVLLIDEVLTPDSSRFWPADQYQVGAPPPSFDKQFVRDWLQQSGWDRNSPPPQLPAEVVARTRTKYLEALGRLTGRGLPGPKPGGTP